MCEEKKYIYLHLKSVTTTYFRKIGMLRYRMPEQKREEEEYINQKIFVMKKIYAMIGASLVLGLSATAAPKALKSFEPTLQKADLTIRHYAQADNETSAPSKEVESVDDLLSPYTWSCEGHLGGEGNPKYGPRENVVMFLAGSDDKHVVVSFGAYDVECAVNISRNTMTFVNQTSVGVLNANDGEAFLYLYKATEGDDGKLDIAPIGNTTCEIDPETGEVFMDEDVLMGISCPSIEPDGRYYYLDGKNVFTPRAWNTPDVADYELIGKGTFSDGWFNPLLQLQSIPAIENSEVDVYRNKADQNIIAVRNPYADAQWKNIGFIYEGYGEGWLLLDCSLKDFICVVPLVDSGVTCDESDPELGETPGSVLGSYYPFNLEGYYQINGEDIESIAEEWAETKTAASVYDPAKNTITLKNLYFGVSVAPMGLYSWTGAEKMDATIVLPDGTLGVNGIAVEDNNNEVRYYNLQGVEISNPVKGQITIVKKGGKAYKEIAK